MGGTRLIVDRSVVHPSERMRSTAKVALFSVDPPGLSTFKTFDPESFSLISAINDALIYIDSEGAVRPSLATAWRRVSPLEMEFTLRQGVKFHNGEAFDADCVVATFHAHRHPSLSASARGVLGAIVEVTRVNDFTVRLRTAFPDAMLVRRLFISAIYPRGVLEQHGRDYFAKHPIGTGPYRLAAYEPGREIVLERNVEHWAGRATVDCLRLPILRQKEWVDRLAKGELDVALGLDSHDRVRAGRIPELHTASRQAAITQWFLLANRGPLADVRVRKAMNHALQRRLLTDITEHGFGAPQRSVATEGMEGYTECEPYRYSPELARSLLKEAGYSGGFKLRGVTSETSTSVYFAVREFLERVGIELETEVVPRAEWIRRVVGGNLQGTPYDGDFALAVFDNPVLHTLFQHFIFLFSRGPYALLRDADYDRQFQATVSVLDDSDASRAQAKLEHYVRDNALVLFTVHEDVHAAWRHGFSCTLPRSGHFEGDALASVRLERDAAPARSLPPAGCVDGDTSVLLEATSHPGAFYLSPGAGFDQPVVERIWDNIRSTEQRWRLQNEPMLRELVAQVEAKTNLANVLNSTVRVGIVGYSAEGRRLFVNKGYETMFGASERPVFEWLSKEWPAIHAQVEVAGSWLGLVHIAREGRPPGAPDQFYLSVTYAIDEDRIAMGYTFVFSDFSGEEERIRGHATRTILGNVPYGLFMCDAGGRVLDGYSVACTRFFVGAEAGVKGRALTELLGMGARAAEHFTSAYEQIFDDILPEDVNLGNLPERVDVGTRTYSLSGSVVRASSGTVESTLFTLLDISELILAEHENEALRSTLQVASHRARFEEFAIRLHRRLQRLATTRADLTFQSAARFELHTAKGVFSQFGLRGLARQIHLIEDSLEITDTDLLAVDAALTALVERNVRLWKIDLEQSVAHFTTTATALSGLEARIAGATSLAEAQRIASEGLGSIRQRTVGEHVGPLAESCREQAERCGKKVRFELVGAELRWPERLAGVFDVLPHLIRNCIDHGIEAPDERRGKAEEGTIRLEVRADAGDQCISLSDDGSGIPTDQVARRALELGVVTDVELGNMSQQARLELIFVEGLSTVEQLSETSGRGVGMAAVKQLVDSLGGELALQTESGRGTALRIRFPPQAALSA
jgi:ABC-type transport system substrate-binding protein/signal transduction histidine kinase